jgi:hypothetical protein
MADWIRTEDWEILRLDGRVVQCAMVRVEVHLKDGVKIKKARGRKKARSRDEGEPLAEVDVQIELLPEHMADFATFRNVLRPMAKGAAREPVQFSHPNTEFWGITAVTITTVESPMPEQGGVWRVGFKGVEWAADTAEVKAKKPGEQKPGDDEEAWAPFAADVADNEAPGRSGAGSGNIFTDLANTLLED